jgi:hypothetical protein
MSGSGSGGMIKLVIAVVLLIAAGTIFTIARRGDSEERKAAQAPRDLVCTKCGQHFQLPGDQATAAFEAAPQPPPPTQTQGPRTRATGGVRPPRMIKCSQCGEMAAVNAVKCEKHNVYYPVTNADGTRGICPQCKEEN